MCHNLGVRKTFSLWSTGIPYFFTIRSAKSKPGKRTSGRPVISFWRPGQEVESCSVERIKKLPPWRLAP